MCIIQFVNELSINYCSIGKTRKLNLKRFPFFFILTPRSETFAAATAGAVNILKHEVRVPRVINTPNFQLKLLDNESTKMSNFHNILVWMEKNDSYFASYKKTSLADLLETPEIVNNQSSSFTKTLYAMKGFARDFAHLRIKSSYNYPEVSEALRRGRGKCGFWVNNHSISSYWQLPTYSAPCLTSVHSVRGGAHGESHRRLWEPHFVAGNVYEGEACNGEVDHLRAASWPRGSLSWLEPPDRDRQGQEEEEEDVQRGGRKGEETTEEKDKDWPSQQTCAGVIFCG